MKRKSEKDHIEEVGKGRFASAELAALIEVRKDSRLVGLEKIRGAIAHEAALIATGFPQRAFNLPRGCGAMTPEARTVCDELLPLAVKAATPLPLPA